MSKDQQSTNIEYQLQHIYFYLTDTCNLRCRHCWIEPSFQSDNQSGAALDVDVLRHVIHQAIPLGLKSVKLTGGEPLIHPHIERIIDHAYSEGLALGIETNGVRCTPELARIIGSCPNSAVSVSLDGATAEIHESFRGVKGCFQDTIRGIRNLVEAGVRPQVIMTVAKSTVDHMEALVELAHSLGAGSVKFNVVQPTARGAYMHEAGETLPIEELVKLGHWVERDLANSSGIPLFFSHPIAFRPMSRMFQPQGNGCDICAVFHILGVLADGSYALCGIGETVPELVFGHAQSDSLEDVWLHAPVLNELRNGLPRRLQGICRDCVMRELCLGCCIAQNYYRSKSLWRPFWYCEEAAKEGLFPDTRFVPNNERSS